ncbi:hypothetical protein FRC20_011495 [Serendipita sp. 405]|nr:hypothetical protein FRC20_011495 [Serendipita sp. 405]
MTCLSTLPVEIWREIFVIVRGEDQWRPLRQEPMVRVFNLCRSYNTRNEFDMRKAQANFSNLLATCKTLQPLIEEILWGSIHLKLDRLVDGTFKRAAVGCGVLGKRRGEWTRELWLTTAVCADTVQECVWPIHALCPNLQGYFLYTDKRADRNAQQLGDLFRVLEGNTLAVIGDWASRITSLSMYSGPQGGPRWPSIDDISRWFPSLHTLIAEGCEALCGRPRESLTPFSTFPCLRRLSYCHWGQSEIILHEINAPKLEFLRIKAPRYTEEMNRILKFLSHTTHPLASLYLQAFSITEQVAFLDRVLKICTELQSLVIDLRHSRSLKLELINSSISRASSVVFPLQQLVLIVDGLLEGEGRGPQLARLLQHTFPPNLFPHIKTITLESESTAEDSIIKLLIETVKDTIPQAEVTWDYYTQAV